MSPKNWFKEKRWSLVIGVIFAIITPLVWWALSDVDPMKYTIPWPLFGVMLPPGICLIAFSNRCEVSSNLAKLRLHLGVDDLRLYMELSPIQMEDLCLRRLKVLGNLWEEAQRNHPVPYARERTEAENAFRSVYYFFEKYKCIKRTKWDRFFAQSETQK